MLPLEVPSELAPAAERSRAHALVPLGTRGGVDCASSLSPNAQEVES